jgi:hypothetical protein
MMNVSPEQGRRIRGESILSKIGILFSGSQGILLAILTVVSCLGSVPARAGLDFSFSFPVLGGGIVRGAIFGLTQGVSAATDVQIVGQPPSFGMSLPLDLFTAANASIGSNSFTLSGTTINAANFTIISDPASLILNSALPTFLLENNVTSAFAVAAGGVTFDQIPEPASAILILTGLLGLHLARRWTIQGTTIRPPLNTARRGS